MPIEKRYVDELVQALRQAGDSLAGVNQQKGSVDYVRACMVDAGEALRRAAGAMANVLGEIENNLDERHADERGHSKPLR